MERSEHSALPPGCCAPWHCCQVSVGVLAAGGNTVGTSCIVWIQPPLASPAAPHPCLLFGPSHSGKQQPLLVDLQ